MKTTATEQTVQAQQTQQAQHSQQTQQVPIWNCTDADCNAWIRDEFVAETAPSCPLCNHSMVRGYKQIPVGLNKKKRTFLIGKRKI